MTETPALVDHDSPWGRHAPARWRAAMLSMAHAVPAHWPGARKLIQALRNPIKHGGQPCYDVTIWGLRMRLSDRGNRSERRLLLAPQLFDPEERAFVAAHLQPGGCFVDIGANAGTFTFWAHRCMQGRGRIVAFEPDPEMHARLRFNLEANRLDHVALEAVALSDHAGTATLYVDRSQRGRNTLDASMAEATGGDRVAQTVALDTLWSRLQALGVDAIDVLKIDIEGHELPVLRHFFANAPRPAWPKALISESAHDADDVQHALLTAAGYRCVLQSDLNRGYVLEAAARGAAGR